MRVAYNTIFRKVFNYRRNESVSEVQNFFGYKSWDDLVETRKGAFKKRHSHTDNSLIKLICLFQLDPSLVM